MTISMVKLSVLIISLTDYLAYVDAQTYDLYLTNWTLWEEFGVHAPYFYLEQMTMLVVSTCRIL